MRQIPEEMLRAIQGRFHELIRARAAEHVAGREFVLPELTPLLTSSEPKAWVPVPGMYGGISYWLEGDGEQTRLMTESWSRVVDGSGQRHEVTAAGFKLVAEGFV